MVRRRSHTVVEISFDSANSSLPTCATQLLVCRPCFRHGCFVYRRRRNWICTYAVHPFHRRRCRVRVVPTILFSLWNLTPKNPTFSVGALYLYSGDCIRKHTAGGLETALGE